MGRAVAVQRLEEHPNVEEILGVLAQVAQVEDAELLSLAARWCNDPATAEARGRALEPDSPLVVEVLAAFDALSALYADDLDGGPEWVTLDPAVVRLALKAARDAIAAAYARPALSRAQYTALMAPWRWVFPHDITEPDLGPASQRIKALLGSYGRLADRCHDRAHGRAWETLSAAALFCDDDLHDSAVAEAWTAALEAGRRRVWTLVRRSAAESLSRGCPRCRRVTTVADAAVIRLGMDAAAGLLVVDRVDRDVSAVLTDPVAHLVPTAWPPRSQRP